MLHYLKNYRIGALLAFPLLLTSATETASVVFENRTLFVVYGGIGRVSAGERASLIQARLYRLAQNAAIPTSAIHTEDSESETEILAGDDRLLAITDKDAQEQSKPRGDVAADYSEKIRGAITEYRRAHSWQRLLRAFAGTILATAVLLVAFILLWRVRVFVGGRIRRWVTPSAKTDHSTARFFFRQIVPLLFAIEMVGRWVLVLLLLNIYLPLVLALFPNTAGISAQLVSWVWIPLQRLGTALVGYLPNLVFLVLIAFVVYGAIRLNKVVFSAIGSGQLSFQGFQQEWAAPTSRLVRLLILVLGIVVAYPYLPASQSPAFKGLSVFIGVLLSIGSSSAVANATAGVILIYTRAFRDGDRIQMGEHIGDVIERSMFVTQIRTIKNEIVTIPNSGIMAGPIVNFSAEARTRGLILHTNVTIGYDTPWRTVHKLLIEAAAHTPGILAEPAPFILQRSLNDFNITYELNAATDHPEEMVPIYSKLHQNIQDTFNEAGVEIMSPNYFSLRDGNKTTIPRENLPPDYEQPAFVHRLNASGDGWPKRKSKTEQALVTDDHA